jgi:hypothetical protein
MNPFDFSAPGGTVMAALLMLGTVLYFLLAERLLAQRFGDGDRVNGLRRLGMIRALLALAPMLGLLGTVCGMINTFYGLSVGCASQEVAGGIHAALYTTEYGLAIAIPAFLLERLLNEIGGMNTKELET